MTRLLQNKRLLLAALFTFGIATAFWTGSRYPELSEKAAMGGESTLEDPLGFDPLIRVDKADPLAARVLYTTVNWLHTNEKGMAFGILLGACFLTALSLFERKSLEGRFSNTLLGVCLGAPLGVCVNCAAPIARGLHTAGTKRETTLAAMISSPTLNVVVLTMLFSLFPLYMALMKLGLTLFSILVMIPVLTRLLPEKRVGGQIDSPIGSTSTSRESIFPEEASSAGGEDWPEALRWFAKSYARSFWYIVRMTLPLMILAGFLGALAVNVLPWESLIEWLPIGGRRQILGAMGVVALIGIFMPVPMAFDVVVTAAFMAAGMPVMYVMILLFTLGIFSIYSFAITWQALGRRMAFVLIFSLATLGLGSGVGAHYVSEWEIHRNDELILDSFVRMRFEAPERSEAPVGLPGGDVLSMIDRRRMAWTPVDFVLPAGIEVDRLAMKQPQDDPKTTFTRLSGESLGLIHPGRHSAIDAWTTLFASVTGIAAGDVHRDGWPDLLFATNHGPMLFTNIGGERFVQQRISRLSLDDHHTSAVALVDMDNDGWLDIVFVSYLHGGQVIYNNEGSFELGTMKSLPESDATYSRALAFGDLDEDGDLDIVYGGYSLGIPTLASPRARDAIFVSNDGTFTAVPLSGSPGETLSILVTDFNDDGLEDLLVANDFAAPDIFYAGEGSGQFRKVVRSEDIFPYSTRTSMSIDSADIDNDLIPEIYMGQISGRTPSTRRLLRVKRPPEAACDELASPESRARCAERMALTEAVLGERRRGARSCLEIDDHDDQMDCFAYLVYRDNTLPKGSRRWNCDLLSKRWAAYAAICREASGRSIPHAREGNDDLRQIRNQNVLFVRSKEGGFRDLAEEKGISIAGWTWNAKFADLDNDGWQDLFVVNGWSMSQMESGFFFRNLGDGSFEDATEEAGLTSYLPTMAYAYLDMDNDGDLDIVTLSPDDPATVWMNEIASREAIAFEIDDRLGNRFGIGSTVIIRYGDEDALHQLREIKASGGYSSMDPPIAHFGLGGHQEVRSVEVRWSTGEPTVIEGAFKAGERYRLRRF